MLLSNWTTAERVELLSERDEYPCFLYLGLTVRDLGLKQEEIEEKRRALA